MSRESRTAFTLIELLVAISVIALLIAILLPTLSMARKTALNAGCMSNQRQWGIAMASYAADSNHHFAAPMSQSSVADYDWSWSMRDYVGLSSDRFHPSNRRPRDTRDTMLVCPAAEVVSNPYLTSMPNAGTGSWVDTVNQTYLYTSGTLNYTAFQEDPQRYRNGSVHCATAASWNNANRRLPKRVDNIDSHSFIIIEKRPQPRRGGLPNTWHISNYNEPSQPDNTLTWLGMAYRHGAGSDNTIRVRNSFANGTRMDGSVKALEFGLRLQSMQGQWIESGMIEW
jgi:prepilin-type N-terminal cleavage/methylation domain-containing protein